MDVVEVDGGNLQEIRNTVRQPLLPDPPFPTMTVRCSCANAMPFMLPLPILRRPSLLQGQEQAKHGKVRRNRLLTRTSRRLGAVPRSAR